MKPVPFFLLVISLALYHSSYSQGGFWNPLTEKFEEERGTRFNNLIYQIYNLDGKIYSHTGEVLIDHGYRKPVITISHGRLIIKPYSCKTVSVYSLTDYSEILPPGKYETDDKHARYSKYGFTFVWNASENNEKRYRLLNLKTGKPVNEKVYEKIIFKDYYSGVWWVKEVGKKYWTVLDFQGNEHGVFPLKPGKFHLEPFTYGLSMISDSKETKGCVVNSDGKVVVDYTKFEKVSKKDLISQAWKIGQGNTYSSFEAYQKEDQELLVSPERKKTLERQQLAIKSFEKLEYNYETYKYSYGLQKGNLVILPPVYKKIEFNDYFIFCWHLDSHLDALDMNDVNKFVDSVNLNAPLEEIRKREEALQMAAAAEKKKIEEEEQRTINVFYNKYLDNRSNGRQRFVFAEVLEKPIDSYEYKAFDKYAKKKKDFYARFETNRGREVVKSIHLRGVSSSNPGYLATKWRGNYPGRENFDEATKYIKDGTTLPGSVTSLSPGRLLYYKVGGDVYVFMKEARSKNIFPKDGGPAIYSNVGEMWMQKGGLQQVIDAHNKALRGSEAISSESKNQFLLDQKATKEFNESGGVTFSKYYSDASRSSSGKKNGTWKATKGELSAVIKFNDDNPQGNVEVKKKGKIIHTYSFTNGKITNFNGEKLAPAYSSDERSSVIYYNRITSTTDTYTNRDDKYIYTEVNELTKNAESYYITRYVGGCEEPEKLGKNDASYNRTVSRKDQFSTVPPTDSRKVVDISTSYSEVETIKIYTGTIGDEEDKKLKRFADKTIHCGSTEGMTKPFWMGQSEFQKRTN